MRKKKEDTNDYDYKEENIVDNCFKDEDKISQKDDSLNNLEEDDKLSYDENENLCQIIEDNNQPKISNINNEFNYQENKNIDNQINFSNNRNNNLLTNNMINNRHYNQEQLHMTNIMNNPNIDNNSMNYFNPNERQIPFNSPYYNPYNNNNNFPPFFQNNANQMDNRQLYLMNNGLNSLYNPTNFNSFNSRGTNNVNNNSIINLRKNKISKKVNLNDNNQVNKNLINYNIKNNINNNSIRKNNNINNNSMEIENKKKFDNYEKKMIIEQTNDYIWNDFTNKIEGGSFNYDDQYSIIYVENSCPDKEKNESNNKSTNNDESKNQSLEDKLLIYSIPIYEKISFPNISELAIIRRINKLNYKLSENDKLIIDNYKKGLKKEDEQFIINENIFYSKSKMSLYYPHILKKSNDIRSIFLNEAQKKLNARDFQYCTIHDNKDSVFMKILERRIQQFNENEFKKENEKKFGFHKNYMYTTIDKDIINKMLKETTLEELRNNLLADDSQVSRSVSNNSSHIEFINNKNISYIKGLSYEEIMTYLILSKVKYDELPRLIFYECYINIKGERIIVTDQGILSGYQEIDYAMLSHSYFDFGKYNYPLYIQTQFYINKENQLIITKSPYTTFEINKDILYFFECKYSLENYKDKENAEDFLRKLFNICKELTNLYISKNFINRKQKVEIIIIYDDKVSNKLMKYKKQISDFIKKNVNFKLKIVYSSPNYSYFYPSLIKDELNELQSRDNNREEEYKKLMEENKILKEENAKREEEYKKIIEILKEDSAKREEEFKKLREEINMLKNK